MDVGLEADRYPLEYLQDGGMRQYTSLNMLSVNDGETREIALTLHRNASSGGRWRQARSELSVPAGATRRAWAPGMPARPRSAPSRPPPPPPCPAGPAAPPPSRSAPATHSSSAPPRSYSGVNRRRMASPAPGAAPHRADGHDRRSCAAHPHESDTAGFMRGRGSPQCLCSRSAPPRPTRDRSPRAAGEGSGVHCNPGRRPSHLCTISLAGCALRSHLGEWTGTPVVLGTHDRLQS